MEPIPIQCNTAMSGFSVSPSLPTGMNLNPTSGLITGNLTTSSDASIIYTVTATNPRGSTTTVFSFRARDQVEMTQQGMTGCYWAEVTECLTPDFSFFYSKPAQICQIVGSIQFTDNYDYTSWPGLDSRFVDYFAAYFYGYFHVLAPGTYQLAMNADDGAILFIDDVDNPVIDIPGCWATSEYSASKTLTTGRHLVIIRYFEYNDGATVYLKLGSTDLGISMAVISAEELRVGGRGPTFISYDFVGGYVGTSLAVTRPELNSGAPHTWSISTLPSGITFDTSNGYIGGIPASTSSGVYTVTATGVNGVASTTVRIVIANTYIPGFHAKYYKIMDANHCLYPALKGNVVSLKSIQVDDNINHPLSASTHLWDNAPSEFTTYFYVEWDGYLKMEVTGNWKMRLTCSSSCKLFGADDQLLISHWGCHEYTSVEATYPVSGNGYYYFRIEYAQNTGEKGIVFEWQSPSGVLEVVPADKIYHAPTGVLSYKTELGHYFKNVAIIDNAPIAFSAGPFTSFSIIPSLPSGLSLHPSTGIISGIPSEEQITSYYTITATSSAGQESTVIGFDVQYVIPPTGLTLTQGTTTISQGSSVSLIALITMTSITVSVPSGITINAYSIKPELPEGLSFSTQSGTISGKPLVQSNNTMYTITASNPGGSTFLLFSLSVSGCKGRTNGVEWQNDFYILYLSTGTASVSILSGSSTIQCGMNEMGSDGYALMQSCVTSLTAESQAVFCVPPETSYTFQLTCQDSYGCYYQLRRQDGNRFPTRLAYHAVNPKPYIDTFPFPTSLTPLTELELSANSIDAVSGYALSTVTIAPNGCYKTIEVTPSLGNGIDVPLILPRLVGTGYGTGQKIYTVTASGDAGTASATLTINYVECSAENGMEIVTFTKTTAQYGTEESYEVYDSLNVAIISAGPFENYATHTVTMCLTSGTYRVRMMDSYGDGWTSGAALKVTGTNGNLIADINWTAGGTKEDSASFTVSVVVVEKEAWKGLLSGQPGKNWYLPGADLSSWSDFTSGTIGTWNQATIYMVRRFTIDDVMQYPIVEFGVYYKDGLIVYLNGNIVYTRNVGSTVHHNSYAVSSYDDYYDRVGSAPGHLLVNGENVLGVEMHRLRDTEGAIQWRGYVKYSPSSCISRIDSGYITESSHYNKDTETAAQAWDRNLETNWIENGLPAWTTYSYNFDRMEWVNKLVIGSTPSDPTLDPVTVNVYGSSDSVNYVLLYSVTKKSMFSSRKETREFMMMDHMTSYGKYKIEITEAASGDLKTGISYLDLLACQLIYCPKDGDYPGAMAGETVTVDCPDGSIGERYRRCGEADLKPEWEAANESECRSMNPPKGTAYVDVAYVFSAITVETMSTSGATEVSAVVSTLTNQLLKNINAWKVKDVTDIVENEAMEGEAKTALYIRLTIKDEDATAVLKAVSESLSSLQSIMRENYASHFKNTVVDFYIRPILSQRKNIGAVSVALIVVLVIVLLVVVAIAGFYIWVRMKSKKTKNGAKQLKSAHRQGKVAPTVEKTRV